LGRSSPQSFEKRKRERDKQRKREEKLERRLIRNEEKRLAKESGHWVPGQGATSGAPSVYDVYPDDGDEAG